LDSIIQETGESRTDLAAKITSKASQFKQAYGTSSGKKRKKEKAERE
jgi:hypothetical protein